MSEETRSLLSWRIVTTASDVTLRAKDVSGESFSLAALGGCESAQLTVRRRATDFPGLGSQSRLVVSSPSGDPLWEGYISDPGDHDDEDGDGLKISAVGSMVRATDVVMPLVYLDADMGSWEASANGAASARADVGDGVMQFGFQSGYPIAAGYVAGFDYRKLAWSPQAPGGVVFTYSCGVAAGYAVDVVAISADNALTTVATWAASTSTVTRTVNGFPAGTKSVRLQMRRTGAATNVVGESAVTKVTSVVFIGSRVDRFGVAATDSATSISSAKVVEDLIGRGVLAEVEPAAAVIEDSTVGYTQLAFPEGVRGSGVLEELRKSDPQMLWQYGPRALGGAGGFEFTWRRWPTVSRYDLTEDDAIDRPGGEDESCQRITVYYTDLAGVQRYETVQVETPAGARVRDADPITLDGQVAQADAIAKGTAALADLANKAAAGTAVVSRLIQDRDTASLIEPYEVRPGFCAMVQTTGEVVQVTGVEWSADGGSVATLQIGETGATLDDKIEQVVRGELVPTAPLIQLPAPTPPPLIPTGIPTTDPTTAPDSSPTPTVQPGPACAMVTLPPITDPHVQVDLHVVAADPSTGNPAVATPNASTLRAQNVAGLVVVSTFADGVTPIPTDADVFFALVARNVAGTATPSAWVAGRAGVVPPEMLQLAVGTLLANDVITTALQTRGIQVANGTWDSNGLVFPGVMNIPANGDPMSITSQINALSAVMTNIRITAGSNFIEGGLDLANGVSAPTSAPRVTSSWTHAAAYDQAYQAVRGYSGLTWYNGQYWTSAWTGSSSAPVLTLIAATPGSPSTLATQFGTSTTFFPYGGAVRVGTSWYFLGTDTARNSAFYVYQYDATSKTKVGEFGVASNATLERPSLATDGTNLFVAYVHTASGQLRVNEYPTTGGLTRYDVLDTAWPDDVVNGLYVGPADLGANRFVVMGTRTVRVYTKAGGASGATQTRVSANDWGVPGGADGIGLAWDGTRFHILSDGSGLVYRMAQRPAAEPRAYAFSFFDSDTGGTGQHETQPGKVANYTAKAREWVRVDMDPPSDGGGNDDPDSLRVYVDNHRQPDLGPGVTMAAYDTLDMAGAVGQNSNGFASLPQSIGTLRSIKSDANGRLIDLEGDGSWRLGFLKGRADGTDANDTGPVDIASQVTSATTDWPTANIVYARYRRKLGALQVQFRISSAVAKDFTAGTTPYNYPNQTIGILPAAARPSSEAHWSGRWNDAPVTGVIQTNGMILVTGGIAAAFAAGTLVSLDMTCIDG